ncbi:rod shape-determining protein MreC [Caryophanon tenue]|uniref:Cell shape-determining protein MreC n=1 Tax=Caryophanon tenue TaxID=33978 RepID=A0A1C0YMP0_9BACL|nr:rod shape-determining protein MreC [Caryophanon tenue]OCS88442.1 rod shape-determining protein MreC [Caryophanon tenue]
MPRFFQNKKMLMLLFGTIFLVALIGFSLRDRDHASLPEQIIKDSVGFGQTIVSKPMNFVTDMFVSMNNILNTYDENERLKARLDEFAVLEAQVSELQLENEKLRAVVEKTEDLSDYESIQATVIARNPDQWEEKIILDKGSAQGVEVNMAVQTATGLVGKVVLVTPFTSEVELLFTNNPNYRVSSMILGEKEEVYGLIEGYDVERGELMMKRIDSDASIEEGEKVVSSGLGGIFPKGILIGEVTEVTTDDFGLTKLAYIKPAADFSLLDHVIIAKRSVTAIDGYDGDNTGQDLTNEPVEEDSES